MDISQWLKDSLAITRKDGLKGAIDSIYPVYHKLHQGIPSPPGTNIFEYDWDVLVVIDACRVDLLHSLVDDFEFLSSPGSVRSVNSQTPRWMEQTFTEEYRDEMSGTKYICANPFSKAKLSEDWFDDLEEVWEDAWIEPGTVPPRAVTDTAIDTARNKQQKRLIIHYLQPHCPFIPSPNLTKGKTVETFNDPRYDDVWTKLRKGSISKKEVWDGYRENARLVLSEVEILLSNINADRLILTSDHGNAIGEWGVYGHPPNMWQDCLREVPWVELNANDEGDYDPKHDYESVDMTREDRLEALGYL